jgi:hypothetical protein
MKVRRQPFKRERLGDKLNRLRNRPLKLRDTTSSCGSADRLADGLSDPVGVVAVCMRHTLMRARRAPVCARLLIREGFPVHALNSGLGQRLLRDSQSCISAKRFNVPGHFLCLISVTGIIFVAIAAELHVSASVTPVYSAEGIRTRRTELREARCGGRAKDIWTQSRGGGADCSVAVTDLVLQP